MKTLTYIVLFALPTFAAFGADADLDPAIAKAISSAHFEASPLQGVCGNVALLNGTDYKNNQAAWDDVMKCKGVVDVQALPETGWFNSVMGRLGKQGDQEEAEAFLKKVGRKAIQEQDFNNKLSSMWQHCAAGAAAASANDQAKIAAEASWWSKQMASIQAEAKGTPDLAKADATVFDQSKCAANLDSLRSTISGSDKGAGVGSEYRINLNLISRMQGGGSLLSKAEGLLGQKFPGESVPLSADEKTAADTIYKKMKADDQKAIHQAIVNAFPLVKPLLAAGQMGQIHLPKSAGVPNWVQQYFNDNGGFCLTHWQDTANCPQGTDSPEISQAAEADLDGAADEATLTADYAKLYQQLSAATAKAPIVPYLKSAKPTDAELADAAKQLLANGETVAKGFQDTLSSGTKHSKIGSSDQERVDNMLSLLKQGNVVRDLLTSDPSLCHAAAGVVSYSGTRDEKNMILGGLATAGLVVATGGLAFAPEMALAGGATITAGAMATTAGTAIVGGISASQYAAYHDALNHTFSNVVADSSVPGGVGRDLAGKTLDPTSAQAYYNGRDDFTASLALNAALAVPGAAALARPALKAAGAAMSGLYKGITAEEVATKGASLFGALKEAGVEEGAAKKLIVDFGGNDIEKAKAASDAMAKALGLDKGNADNIAAMLKADLLNPDFKPQIAKYTQFRNSVPKEMKESYDKALQDFVGGLKPHELNAELQDSVLQVAQSIDKFTGGDLTAMNKAFEHIKNWPDKKSIEGMASAYDQAAENLAKPEIQALPVAERHDAAFKMALKDNGFSDEEVGQMMDCAGRPKA